MPKKLDLTDNLEKYIIEHSDDLTGVQKKILNYQDKLLKDGLVTNILKSIQIFMIKLALFWRLTIWSIF